MKILSAWVRAYLPPFEASDHQLADDLTLRGIAVDGVFDLGPGNGSVFEMDITTNRVDAMNHYGIAREAAAIYSLPLTPLDASLPAASPAKQPFPVHIEAKDLCGRFTARVLRNVTIEPSRGEVAKWFTLLEQKQIANAVDATNFVTLGMGHPTHTFDLDKLEGGIIVRRAKPGERLKLLDGTERTLTDDDLVVADERKALALAGVMGGWDSMITPETKNILVEAAWFDPAAVRRSSRRHGLHTDASHRFERGADFAAPPLASALVSRLVLAAGGEIEGELVDTTVPEWVARTIDRPAVELRIREVARILGPVEEGNPPLDATTCEQTLTALGVQLKETSAGEYAATLPSWRLDLEREIDLTEEIARLYGYNRFANTLPAFSGAVVKPPQTVKESEVRSRLLAAGYSEAVGSTFLPCDEAAAFALQPNSQVALGNPLSEEAGCLRTSLAPGMLAMLAYNLNREVENVRLFEIGATFAASGDRVAEKPSLAIGATGAAMVPQAMAGGRDYSFYDMKGVIEEILAGFTTKRTDFDAFPVASGLMPSWLHPGRSARIVADGETIGYFGQVAPQEAQRRKLRQKAFIGELDLERLFRHTLREPSAHELSRFPAVQRDISFRLPRGVEWRQVAEAVHALGIREMIRLEPHEILDAAKIDKPSGKRPTGTSAGKTPDSYFLVLRIVFQAPDRTLRVEELQDWAHRIFSVLVGLGGEPRFPAELL